MSAIENGTDYMKSLAIGAESTEKSRGYNDLQVDDFLNLMIAEISNQNPTQPMDNAQLSAQMAQFASVSGLDELNTSFDELAGSLTSDQALQAASLVGHQVTVPGYASYMPSGGSIEGVIPLESDSSEVSIRVTDASGSLIKELNLGAQNAGNVHFKWDGMTDIGEYATSGNYYLEVQAMVNGKPQSPTPLINAKVDSVSLGGSGQPLTLNLEGLGSVSLDEVVDIH